MTKSSSFAGAVTVILLIAISPSLVFAQAINDPIAHSSIHASQIANNFQSGIVPCVKNYDPDTGINYFLIGSIGGGYGKGKTANSTIPTMAKTTEIIPAVPNVVTSVPVNKTNLIHQVTNTIISDNRENKESSQPIQTIHHDSNSQKNTEFINNLNYDLDKLLTVYLTPGPQTHTPSHCLPNIDGSFTCWTEKNNKAEKSQYENLILSTNEKIYPGALVKEDSKLAEGDPDQYIVLRAPYNITFDRINSNNDIIVRVPTYTNVGREINKSLDDWFKNQQATGYDATKSIQLVSGQAYTKEQIGVDLGIGAQWPYLWGASGNLDCSSSNGKNYTYIIFKQIYYSVIVDPPLNPGSTFADSVFLGNVINTSDAEKHPPGYISKVDYGRIIIVQIETSEAQDQAKATVNAKQSTPISEINGSTTIERESTMKESKFSYYIIGGGSGSAGILQANDLESIKKAISVDTNFSKGNPGCPISYEVRDLKTLEKVQMKLMTDYTMKQRNILQKHNITLKQLAGRYSVKFFVSWDDHLGKHNPGWRSDRLWHGTTKIAPIPGDATNITVTGVVYDLNPLSKNPIHSNLSQPYPSGLFKDETICTKGSPSDPYILENDCR